MTDKIDNDEEEFAESTLIQAIENQIESDNPPAAKATYNKLTLVGYEREEILQLMAHVLAVEIDGLLEEDRAFNTEWYEAALRALPTLPPEARAACPIANLTIGSQLSANQARQKIQTVTTLQMPRCHYPNEAVTPSRL